MREITIREFTEKAMALEPNQAFYIFADQQNGEYRGYFGVTCIKRFEAYHLLVNYMGGGDPFLIDVTTYYSDLHFIEEQFDGYFRDRCGKEGRLYLDEAPDLSTARVVCKCGNDRFRATMHSVIAVEVYVEDDCLLHDINSEEGLSNDYYGPYICTECNREYEDLEPAQEQPVQAG